MRSHAAMFLLLSAVTASALAQQAPQRMYKCIDARGRVYYTQVPPPECLGRDTEILNKSGTLIRKTTRQPTPAEIQAREAERKKKLEENEKSREERRKNLALLNTYSSEKDIEDARTRALQEAQTAIEDTQKRIAGAQKHQKDLETEKEFYVKKPMPLKLRQDIANTEIEIKNQTALLEVKKREISTVNAKYDEDKRRYIELTTGKAAAK
ncbi:MAG TPA: DUF4124 domain-containing protein [Burkholderiales bacterium]|nr:DUF4124 domain-containing protein [Burkholderiales bacterium]